MLRDRVGGVLDIWGWRLFEGGMGENWSFKRGQLEIEFGSGKTCITWGLCFEMVLKVS